MVIEYVLFALGIFLLIKCSGWIVEGASSLAKKLGVSTLIIGLTVVAFGTSLPELIVNILAALQNSPGIIFGNILGSNIANILLVLGFTAIIGHIKLKNSTIWKEIPFALFAVFVLFLLSSRALFNLGKPTLIWTDSLILLSMFAIFLYYIFQVSKKKQGKLELVRKTTKSSWIISIKLVVGLIGIYFGGRLVVDGAVFIAGQFGLSQFLISSTIIALGTSLPELVVCIIATVRNKIDLAIGNVIGSNIFNILWVLGIIPLIRPIRVPSFVILDIAIVFFATLLLFIFMFIGKKHGLRRKSGFLFVSLYILYILFLIIRG
jgi:cation:H+ antiporter